MTFGALARLFLVQISLNLNMLSGMVRGKRLIRLHQSAALF